MFDNVLTWDLSGEVISSLIVMTILVILFVTIGIMARRHDPLKPTKGLLWLGEFLVDFFDKLTVDMMGKRFASLSGFVMAIGAYLFISFIFGLTGLPSPVSYLAVPLSLGLITFTMIHATSIKYTHWGYFKRYIDPFPVFLPINLVSMWAPLLSLTLRLFGNAISGWVLMTMVYTALNFASVTLIDGTQFGLLAPFITPALHAYFDLFSGFIQTTVFLFLSMIFVSNEAPEDDEYDVQIEEVKEGGR